jgi:ribulose-phosphate 3-epimerase
MATTMANLDEQPDPSQNERNTLKTVGFNHPLYILPFDHRGSFETKMFGWHGDLNPGQIAEIVAAKQAIYDGFKSAIAAGVQKKKAGILVDEQFGVAILRDAKANGFTTACPAEKSGQEEFDFEYGADFSQHIETIQPTFCKVLVRYNPEGDSVLNRRQTERLRILSDYLHAHSESRFMFELLVPPEPVQLDRLMGDMKTYDLELRPKLMMHAMQDLQDAGVEPDVWKIEGLDRREDCEKIVAIAKRGGREQVGCIVLGRGENCEKVREWLTTAASVPGFIGFAVGRTDFWEPLVHCRAGRITREVAVLEIGRRFQEFVRTFESASKTNQSLQKAIVKLAPSVLAADFARLGEQIAEAERSGADRIHIDVMDGHFVPNISLGPVIVQALRKVTRLPLEIHMMVTNPDLFLEEFCEAGADSFLVHCEGNPNLHRTVQLIKARGKRAGVVINPATPAAVIEEILPDADQVLVMTVNPGFGNQHFLRSTLTKVRRVRQMIEQIKPACDLEVDGGINPETAPLAVSAGANVLVAGTSIFGDRQGVVSAMKRLQTAANARESTAKIGAD